MPGTSTQALTLFGGEFSAPERESVFQAERLPDTLRHTRLLFLLSAVLNTLFFISDWRFHGTSHFYVAIPARTVVVLIALLCLWFLRKTTSFQGAQKVMIAWEWVTAAAVGVLVSSHSDLALFVVLMLPSIYYLVVPTAFRWSMTSGVACSVMMLIGYLSPGGPETPVIGLILAVVTLNVALALVLTRSNRLQRTEWAATQAERRANQELTQSRAMFETMFKTVPIPLVVVRTNGEIVDSNEAGTRYFGAHWKSLGIQSVDEVYINPADRKAFVEAIQKDGQVTDFETLIRLADGSIRTVLLAGRLIDINGAPHIMSAAIDITERKAAEERSWRVVSHDALTDLPNRAFFQGRLEQALAEAERQGTGVSLLLIDLDKFKAINDSLGHDAGDVLLKGAADRLRRLIRDDDTIARLGGDEFIIVIADPAPLVRARELSERILTELRQPIPYGAELLTCHVSIGVASFPAHGSKPSELMKDADLALNAAKARGRNCAVVYTPDMRLHVEHKATVARGIQEALQWGQIVPFYQPKVDLSNGRVVGFEALARWRHPQYGLLTPAAFSSAFEDPELSIAVGESIIRQVASDIRRWINQGCDCGRVAVNLSSAQFNWIGLAKRFLEVLQSADVPNHRLEVEITETVFLGRSATHVAKALKQFHDNGIRIALDDFGTGYASLIHLKQFPVDDIKIDQSFVRDLETDAENAAIVLAVIELGMSLGMDVIAEGVETVEQARFLKEKGCQQAQGNFYAAPMSGKDVPSFLKSWEPPPLS
ncbi:putative bifunctional diguanylate cyclase/phosphodiesterase [Microvirga rosea]|uniref:putative bifunctional diguanylate cyclase/phosphodiesterase n=1 Tax=Microvirga rosea TaxID=2715425 RepID=UPI001D099F44|nr:EAL domain-containing protein [Microvirga rosea]MCB8822561.1 EAL domain-containing protein [Microvirga rosea]